MNSRLWGLGCGALLAILSGAVNADSYKAPRLSDGQPDLQGNWTNGTATPFERAKELGNRRAFTAKESAEIHKAAIDRVAEDAKPIDVNENLEAKALPPVGNYNLFWTERGDHVVNIDGEDRTSIIVDPADGHIPPMTDAAKKRPRTAFGIGKADGPEQRSLGERCILSFGSSAGPPMLPTMYNSNYQIVQGPGYVTIMAEMVHDARMIRLGGHHPPANIRKWMGDSIGHWEGETLVVETTNFRPEQNFRGSSENAVITERFKRVDKDKIVYSFTINDPTTFTAPFTGELAFEAYPDKLFEYACHEGNYALPGILQGARVHDQEEAAKQEASLRK
jgi:hypothetical protein